MDDRVRIYELARRMNVANQDVIVVLRELGYDIKSHSSTIDKTAVGLLIAAIEKKKQKDGDGKGKAKPAAATSSSSPSGSDVKPSGGKAPGGKTPAKLPPPPEPVVVKPRVLARYRPERPPVDGGDDNYSPAAGSSSNSGISSGQSHNSQGTPGHTGGSASMITGSNSGVPIGTGLGASNAPIGHQSTAGQPPAMAPEQATAAPANLSPETQAAAATSAPGIAQGPQPGATPGVVPQTNVNAGGNQPSTGSHSQSAPSTSGSHSGQGASPINSSTQISSRPITSSGHISSNAGLTAGSHQAASSQAGQASPQSASQAPSHSAGAQPSGFDASPGAPNKSAEPEEPINTLGKKTGDSWSDESRYAPRAIRKLDQQQQPKAKPPEPAKPVPGKVDPAAPAAGAVPAPGTPGSKDYNGRDAGKDKEARKHGKPEEEDNRTPGVRPMSPSVPIRVAAPSMRATPPRPPKSHRPNPSDRHAPKKEEKARPAPAPEVPKAIVLKTNVTVQELAAKMQVPETEIIKRLFMKGIVRTVNMVVELEIARDLATEMEYEVLSTEDTSNEPVKEVVEMSEEDKAALVTRPPVVTIMGHVDHGKTSLLDAIRQTKFLLTDSEHGGITQHIGAYHVEVPDEEGHVRQIVFLDTPGHEAFTAMRARGAKVTDIAILVVAADDGVMPQTAEAIDHVKAAGVPIIVAVNKIDKAGADPDRVISQLMEHELVAEKFGGQTITVEVSAKKRTGLDTLLEMILLVSDVLELKANPEKPANGVIIEAELSRGKGAVATALVENGTLREGDFIVAGSKMGRVRALFDDRGQRVKAAGPSMPVEVLGLDEVPLAGDTFQVVSDAQAMKALAEAHKLTENSRSHHHVTLESLHDLLERGEVKDLNIIVKADVQGTAEAIADTLRKLSTGEVQTRVLRTASGDISENDVNLAASSNAIIVGFNVNPDQNASRVAEGAGVDIRTYSIIYQITDDITSAIQGLLKPIREEVNIGQAEVRQIFKVGKGTMIAGCMVLDRQSPARIARSHRTRRQNHPRRQARHTKTLQRRRQRSGSRLRMRHELRQVLRLANWRQDQLLYSHREKAGRRKRLCQVIQGSAKYVHRTRPASCTVGKARAFRHDSSRSKRSEIVWIDFVYRSRLHG